MDTVNTYTLSELSNGNNKIIIEQNGICIGLELEKEGISLYQYFPTDLIKREFDHLIKRKDL